MNIDLELHRIIKRNKINKFYPSLENLYKKEIADELINDLFGKFDADKKVALKGDTQHIYEFARSLSEKNRKKITYIIDWEENQSIEGYEIIQPIQIGEKNVEIIILTSFNNRLEMKLELLENVEEVEFIDLYDYFCMNFLYFEKEYYKENSNEMIPHITYSDLYCTRRQYELEANRENKEYFLELLIFQCVEIRDFLSAKKYVEEYLSNYTKDREPYLNFLSDLEKLWIDMKEELVLRKNDILINWVDNVCFDEMMKTKYAQELAEESTVFSNAYNVTPWTYFSQMAIFTGKIPIEDKTYYRSEINENTSEWLKVLKDAGYDFTYIANPGMYQDMFLKDNLASFPSSFHKLILKNRAISECSTRLQWVSLKERIRSKHPVCHLIHNLAETHPPYFYSGMSSASKNRRKHRILGLNFMMDELRWYAEFVRSNDDYIILSDHGDGVEAPKAYMRERSNIPILIRTEKLQAGIEKRMLSHQNFCEIIKYLLLPNKEQYEHIFKEVIHGENLDFYNYNFIVQHILEWMQGDVPIDMAHFQSRHIRTGEDLFVKYACGKELYFRLPDENTNLIDAPEWKERTEYLRKECGNKFINIQKDPVFKDSHVLYQYLEFIGKHKIKW